MQNSIRIGTDIVEFSQISEEMVNDPNFAYELLTKDEMKLYEALGAMEKVTFLAGRYARQGGGAEKHQRQENPAL